MDFEIEHWTHYQYDREVELLPHLLYLRPRDTPLLQVREFNLSFQPEAQVDWMRDDFDNLCASIRFDSPSPTLSIHSRCSLGTKDLPPFDFLVRDYARRFPFAYEPLHRFNLSLYLCPPAPFVQSSLLRWIDGAVSSKPEETVAWLFELNAAVSRNLGYQRREERGIQTSEQTINLGSGTCRDFAVLLVDCARTLGLAARFVSGYLFDPLNNGNYSGDMHAWVEIFLPGAGWRGLDPTNGVFCHNGHMPVAHAVVAESVNPVQGSFFSHTPATARLTVDVRIRSIQAIPAR